MNERQWQRRHYIWSPLLFLAPAAALFAVFTLYPLGRSAVLCFYNSAGPHHRIFVGMANVRFLMRDPLFWIACGNTAAYTLLFVALYLPISLALAVLLHSSRVRGRNFLRGAFLSTYLVGQVFVAVIFALLLTPRHGWLSRAIATIAPALGDFDPKTHPLFALPTMVGLSLWFSVGYAMVYLLAALSAIEPELYAAAAMDGAGSLWRFWHITLPSLRPTLALLTLAATIASFQLFELPYLFFNGPGPAFSGLTIVMYLYQQGFEVGNLGYASAIGWALAILLSIVAAVQLRFLGLLRRPT